MYHSPVMPQESIDSLNILSDGIYVGLTFGGGGHSKLILNNLSSKGKLIAFDQDTDAFQNKIDDSRFILINQNFKFLQQNLKYNNVLNVDGVFADLGVSSHQFDSAVRGFSIRYDSEIDMRMNTNSSFDAQEILNEYSESQLSNILFEYADLRNSKEISKTIVEARTIKKITRTSQLNEILSSFLPKGFENKILAKIYQALRIEVNQEMHALKEVLLQLPSLVNKGGIISFITYHSIEDRIVKRFIQNGCFESEPLKNEFGVADIPFKKKFKLLNYFSKEDAYYEFDIRVQKLENYIVHKNLTRIDFLKIDTEGYEYEILLGLGNKISLVKILMFEHHYDNMIIKNYTFTDINNFLKMNNFNQIYKSKMPFRKTFEYIYKREELIN